MGITLSAVGVVLFGIERTLLPVGSAASATIAMHVVFIGVLGLSGWLLGRLAVRSRILAVAEERASLALIQHSTAADFSGTVTPVDSAELRKRENIRLALYNILDATTRSQTLDELLVSIHEQVKTV
ncbi:MAG: hypothetical protein M3Z05_16775, partial [Gemmatimonadota bacterium]|nr:hypothetical protein [Gemmatimonadota bacterium]